MLKCSKKLYNNKYQINQKYQIKWLQIKQIQLGQQNALP